MRPGRMAVAIAAIAVAVAVAALSAGTAADDGSGSTSASASTLARQDREGLQGLWSMTAFEADGAKGNPHQMKAWVLVVEGSQYNPGVREHNVEFSFELHPTRTPKAIDLIAREPGRRGGRPIRGIYELRGDEFTFCRPIDPHGERPAGFSGREGTNQQLVVWKRRKAEREESGPGKPADAPSAPKAQ